MQRAALALWREEGVDAAAVRRIAGTPSGEALILVEAQGENQIAILGGAKDTLSAGERAAAIRDAALALA